MSNPTRSTGRGVDAATRQALSMAYKSLVKAGNDSVRAAWRFGQTIDSFSDSYQRIDLADAMGLSVSTLNRYLRFYRAYQRPELALEASAELETYNIDTLWELQLQRHPGGRTRPLAGRHFHYTCRDCGSHEVAREEVEEDEGYPVSAVTEAAQ